MIKYFVISLVMRLPPRKAPVRPDGSEAHRRPLTGQEKARDTGIRDLKVRNLHQMMELVHENDKKKSQQKFNERKHAMSNAVLGPNHFVAGGALVVGRMTKYFVGILYYS